jgi:hypothetical protein
MDEGSAVLAAVQDASRRLCRCHGILDSVCARRSADRQVGTKEWSRAAEQRNEAHPFADVFALMWSAS